MDTKDATDLWKSINDYVMVRGGSFNYDENVKDASKLAIDRINSIVKSIENKAIASCEKHNTTIIDKSERLESYFNEIRSLCDKAVNFIEKQDVQVKNEQSIPAGLEEASNLINKYPINSDDYHAILAKLSQDGVDKPTFGDIYNTYREVKQTRDRLNQPQASNRKEYANERTNNVSPRNHTTDPYRDEVDRMVSLLNSLYRRRNWR